MGSTIKLANQQINANQWQNQQINANQWQNQCKNQHKIKKSMGSDSIDF
jgi:hypothetical protein